MTLLFLFSGTPTLQSEASWSLLESADSDDMDTERAQHRWNFHKVCVNCALNLFFVRNISFTIYPGYHSLFYLIGCRSPTPCTRISLSRIFTLYTLFISNAFTRTIHFQRRSNADCAYGKISTNFTSSQNAGLIYPRQCAPSPPRVQQPISFPENESCCAPIKSQYLNLESAGSDISRIPTKHSATLCYTTRDLKIN